MPINKGGELNFTLTNRTRGCLPAALRNTRTSCEEQFPIFSCILFSLNK